MIVQNFYRMNIMDIFAVCNIHNVYITINCDDMSSIACIILDIKESCSISKDKAINKTFHAVDVKYELCLALLKI